MAPPPPILVVDDNPLTRRLIRAALAQQGFAVQEAADGAGALAAAAGEVALILLDLRLPDVDGFELAERLRALPRGREVPLLAVSGVLSKAEESRIGTAGFDDVISKPVDPVRLVEIVRAHLPSVAAARDKFGAGKRLVVADDDPVQRKLACFRLARLGFEVTGAADGNAALARAREVTPDVIVSDVLMPGLDGFGLCVAVRQDLRLAATPIILMTNSYVEAQDRALARRAGAYDLLFRTPELDDVIAALRTVLSSTTPRVQPSEVPAPELERERVRRVLSQLDRQVALNAGMTQRCALLSAELSVLSGVAEALAREGNTDEALREVLAGCLDAGGISNGALYLTNPRRSFGLGTAGIWSDEEIAAFFGERTFLEKVKAARSLVVLGGDATGAGKRLLERLHVGSAVIATLHHRGVVLGALFMVARTDELCHEDRVTFAQAVAGQMSQALAVAGAFAEKEAAARAAREQATILRSVLESLTEGVIVADQDGHLIHFNPAARKLLGDQLDGTHVFLDDRRTLVPRGSWPLERAVRGETVDRVELFVRTDPAADGISLAASARPLREDGGVRGGIMVMRDVTTEKAANAQLMVSDRMASIGMLAAGMAHEINNPLAAVVMSVDLALDHDLPQLRTVAGADVEALGENLRDARDGAARVAEIVRDLKIFSRSDEDKRAPVDVRHVLASSIRMARNELRHRAQVIEEYGDIPPVLASESRLGQVFLNLLVNAAQALTEGKADRNEVRVSTRVDAQGRVEVAIADSGPGIAPEVRARLFTPFFTTKGPGEGTGLGLAICQRIVYGLGGEIDVESGIGKGTVFRVRLPPFHGAVVAESPAPPVIIAPTRRGRILVIDDDRAIIGLLGQALGGEHDIIAMESAPAALARLAGGERFDAILCDLMMPIMTGMELHERLALTNPDAAARIIFMTGGAFTPHAATFLAQVSNPLIEKPFDMPKLKAILSGRV